jgi:hypothetical protein
MGFNPQDVEDAIRNAGALLAQQWKNPGMRAPENDLHPDPAAVQFRVKILEDRVSMLENLLKQALQNGRK